MTQVCVIIPAHDCAPFLRQCLDSVKGQDFPYSSITIASDAATSETTEVIRTWWREHRLWHAHSAACVWTAEHGGELASVIEATENSRVIASPINVAGQTWADDTTVIAHVCGDDYLPDPHVLSRLAAVYADPDVWMTYGSYAYDNGEPGPCEPLPPQAHTQGDYRDRPWVTSHLRSYRYGLWKRIPPEQLLDPATGAPWFYATDRAMMYPMLEMAREHARFIQDVMYVYRRHPGNVPPTADAGHCQRVANMPRLARLETIYGD